MDDERLIEALSEMDKANLELKHSKRNEYI